MKIGFISSFSPHDKKASSGTNYSMVKELSKLGEIKWLPIKKRHKAIGKLVSLWNKIAGRHIRRLQFYHTIWGSKHGYENLSSEDYADCDILIAFFCSGYLSNLKSTRPIIYFTDATFPAMLNYYEAFTNLPKFNQRQGIQIEKQAMENSDCVIVSSDWAKESAIDDLGIDSTKLRVIEFGANVDESYIKDISRRIGQNLNLLFLGVDWLRKGGEIAVEATRWLNDHGIKTTLHCVGIPKIPVKMNQDEIMNHGYLNKNVKEEYLKLIKLLESCDALLLPTKAECSAIAFSESSAYGLPAFTHKTGGTANYIENGVNGYLLPLGSTGEDFGRKIKECFESGELQRMAETSKMVYNNKLNWGKWGEKVRNEINHLISETPHTS